MSQVCLGNYQVNSLTIDLLSLSVLGILVMLAIIAVIVYFKFQRPSKEKQTIVTQPENEVVNEITRLREDMKSKFQSAGSTSDVLDEVRKLHQDFESRFGAKFSKEGFTSDDAYSLFLAFSNSINRFDRDRVGGLGSNVVTEAKGYVAMARLVLSWAQANGEDGVKAKAEDFLNAAKENFERASHL